MTSPETAGPQTSTDGGYTLIEHLPFTTAKVIGARARIGLVVLASDYTIEPNSAPSSRWRASIFSWPASPTTRG